MDYSKFLKEGLKAALQEELNITSSTNLGKAAEEAKEKLETGVSDEDEKRKYIDDIRLFVKYLKDNENELDDTQKDYLKGYSELLSKYTNATPNVDEAPSEEASEETPEAPDEDDALEASLRAKLNDAFKGELTPEVINSINSSCDDSQLVTSALTELVSSNSDPESIFVKFKQEAERVLQQVEALNAQEKSATTEEEKLNIRNQVAQLKTQLTNSPLKNEITTKAAQFSEAIRTGINSFIEAELGNTAEAAKMSAKEQAALTNNIQKLLNSENTVTSVESLANMPARDVWKNGFIKLAQISRNYDNLNKTAKAEFGIGFNSSKLLMGVASLTGVLTTVGRVMSIMPIPGIASAGKLIQYTSMAVGGAASSIVSGKKAIDAAKNGDWGKALAFTAGAIGAAAMCAAGAKGLNSTISTMRSEKEFVDLIQNPHKKLEELNNQKAEIESKKAMIDSLPEKEAKIVENTERMKAGNLEPGELDRLSQENAKLSQEVAATKDMLGNTNLADFKASLEAQEMAVNESIASTTVIAERAAEIKSKSPEEQRRIVAEAQSAAPKQSEETAKEIKAEVAEKTEVDKANRVSDAIDDMTHNDDGTEKVLTPKDIATGVLSHRNETGSYADYMKSPNADPRWKTFIDSTIGGDPNYKQVNASYDQAKSNFNTASSNLNSQQAMMDKLLSQSNYDFKHLSLNNLNDLHKFGFGKDGDVQSAYDFYIQNYDPVAKIGKFPDTVPEGARATLAKAFEKSLANDEYGRKYIEGLSELTKRKNEFAASKTALNDANTHLDLVITSTLKGIIAGSPAQPLVK